MSFDFSSLFDHRDHSKLAEVVLARVVMIKLLESAVELRRECAQHGVVIVTEGRERANRRTVTEVSGFVETNPLVLNGKYAEIVFREYIASAGPKSTLDGTSGADFSTEN